MSDATIRTFTDAIAVMEDGQLLHDLTEKQRDLIGDLNNAIQDGARSAKGTLTLKIDYKLEGGVIETQADLKTKTPEPKRERSMMWATPENNLSRSNPKQRDIFEEIEGGAQPVRKA